nr:immunoglobulin light chain junction region [Macaca mulatta]MOW72321.1 immunoglobulin light chain junction region [Macaca mulatta]
VYYCSSYADTNTVLF